MRQKFSVYLRKLSDRPILLLLLFVMFQHKAEGAHSRQDAVDIYHMAAEGLPLG